MMDSKARPKIHFLKSPQRYSGYIWDINCEWRGMMLEWDCLGYKIRKNHRFERDWMGKTLPKNVNAGWNTGFDCPNWVESPAIFIGQTDLVFGSTTNKSIGSWVVFNHGMRTLLRDNSMKGRDGKRWVNIGQPQKWHGSIVQYEWKIQYPKYPNLKQSYAVGCAQGVTSVFCWGVEGASEP